MSDKPEKFIDENGLRLDGRQINEIRQMKIKIGVLSRADGSCYLEWGNNKILVAVYGPRELHPRRLQKADSALIRYRYNMAAFSVEDRIRPGPSRRSIEISKVSREAFEPVIMTHLYPGAVIDVFAEVLQADAGTRTAAINAASIALADAGIPMKSLVSACAVGKVDGQLVLDLNKAEDNYGQADLPVAMTQDGEITLLQMDGNLTPEEFKRALEMCKEGCRQIMEMQKEALRNKFADDHLPIEVPDEIVETLDVAATLEDVVEENEGDEVEVDDSSEETVEEDPELESEVEVETGDADEYAAEEPEEADADDDILEVEEESVDLIDGEAGDEDEGVANEGSETREQ
ncbi:MAG: exosome complex exonuclease Rrp41 [Methanolobus sp.]|uniref:exosome complex exonuclease Rrp41 n=1 Tax=Methanolobus sp. TaxID=1874737 RepID=UPI00273092C1|nr:exosome complex exonuclease Rrp41 [Methanolobus sp.]MDP2218465.1 exosome complex exonuclease Rrp41 [Methanolobus sp.]